VKFLREFIVWLLLNNHVKVRQQLLFLLQFDGYYTQSFMENNLFEGGKFFTHRLVLLPNFLVFQSSR